MDIKKIISDYHNASETDKVLIEKQVEREFSALSENEKKEVQQIFLKSLDNTMEEARDLLKEINLKIELERVSEYISMS
jgi:DNA polymerase III delta prime subunit